MAFPTEDFNGYSDGALPGNNGGSGWSGAWTDDYQGIKVTVQGSVVFEGAKAASGASSSDGYVVSRSFTAVTADNQVVHFVLRRASNSDGTSYTWKDGSTAVARVQMTTDGNLKIRNGAGTDTIQATSTGVFYEIELKFDFSNQNVYVRVDGGSWSAAKSFMNSASQLTKFEMDHDGSNSGTIYIDDIRDTTPPDVTPHSITAGQQYAIKTTTPTSKSAQYEVATPQGIVKNTKYQIKTHWDLGRLGEYRMVTTPPATQIPVVYDVVPSIAVTKSLKYTVPSTHAPIGLPMKYETARSLTKVVKYIVRVNPYSRKTNPFLKKSTPYVAKTSPYRKLKVV